MATYAYVRVSTKEQKIDRQMAAIKEFEIPKKNIYCDWQSGKDFDRPAYQKLLKRLKRGDLLVIKSIDRLGRNYDEILRQWQHITKEIEADIVVIDMTLLDTRNHDQNLTGTLIADLVLQILAYVAQTERDFIKQRQQEGIKAARDRGVKFGRPENKVPAGFEEMCERYLSGQISVRKAAETVHMPPSTFYRKARAKRLAPEGECQMVDYPEQPDYGDISKVFAIKTSLA